MARSSRAPLFPRVLLALGCALAACWGAPRQAWVAIAGAAPAVASLGRRSGRVAVAGQAKDGLFTPAVGVFKEVMGEAELKKLRAEVIKAHGNVMGDFIETSETNFGRWTLRRLFDAADKDKNGKLDQEEVMSALLTLGFKWMEDEKKIAQLVKKADRDGDGLIDFEEFKNVAPTALKQNLLKLAKGNGGELGMLS